MKFFRPIVFLFTCAMFLHASGQQTVGIFLNRHTASRGYVLLAPSNDSTTYLINNCGQVVHKWKSNRLPGLSTWLLEDGSLLRSVYFINPQFGNQGGGGVEKRDWNGNLTWEYRYSSAGVHQHHDITPLPNGNVLMLAFEYKTETEAADAGRKVSSALWPEHIVEVRPEGTDSGTIVWEWHAWDHAVQEYDSLKANYATVADHPELFNLNYPPGGGNGNNPADWMHGNGLDYNAELDQVMLSSRSFSEFFVIDHATTTTQARGHNGGRYGKGGDILYRWGNPSSYNRGDSNDRKLYFQHNAHWIRKGLKGAGHILVFNNGTGRPGGNFSTIDEIAPPIDSAGFYTQPVTGGFGPDNLVWSYESAIRDSFYSAFISGAERMPNGNTHYMRRRFRSYLRSGYNESNRMGLCQPFHQHGHCKPGNIPDQQPCVQDQ